MRHCSHYDAVGKVALKDCSFFTAHFNLSQTNTSEIQRLVWAIGTHLEDHAGSGELTTSKLPAHIIVWWMRDRSQVRRILVWPWPEQVDQLHQSCKLHIGQNTHTATGNKEGGSRFHCLNADNAPDGAQTYW